MDDKLAAAARNSQLLKKAKEDFVTGLSGGTIGEINLITLVAPASILLWSVLQSRQRLFTPYNSVAGLADFLLNCAAILFATTLYSSQPLILNTLLVVPAVITYFGPTAPAPARRTPKLEKSNGQASQSAGEPDPLPVKPFVTNYRGTMMVITCVAILAVDFRVFPRRFAKVENWGTSLMDLGVGSFVFSAGTVAARPILKQQGQKLSKSLWSRLRSAGRHSAPLLALGLIRLYAVKGLDYAEHVTEYGVHWNFFFTLALLPPFVAVFDSIFSFIPFYELFGLALALAYQVVLDSTDLKGFILTAPRTDLLSKNREGVFSFFGYLAIFLMGQGAGMKILPRRTTLGAKNDQTMLYLISCTVLCGLSTFMLIDYRFGVNLSVSRRLANLPYVLWVAAFNYGQIYLFYLIEIAVFPDIYTNPAKQKLQAKDATSRILRSFNRNGLAVFLLANLLTGLVNMTLPTLSMGHMEAVGVLLVYMGVLSAVALLLDAYDVSIKL